MKNRFEVALDQDEIPDFFKGNGVYFARGSDWGDHLYISNWEVMCGTLKTQKPAQSLLTNLFEEYLKYLGDSYKDAEGLLFNISAYYGLKNTLPFLSAENYDLIDSLDDTSKHIIGQTFRRLRKEYDLENKDLPATAFDQLMERIRKNGCNISLEDL